MNRAWWVATLLLLTLMPAPASAQAGPLELASDASGDVVMQTRDGQLSQADASSSQDVDLTGFGVWAEDDEFISLYATVASLTESSQKPVPFSDPDYRIYFSFGETHYRARIDTALDNPTNAAMGRADGSFARLEMESSNGQWRSVTQLDLDLRFDDDMLVVSIPRDAVVDHNQAPLGLNRTLTNMWAQAELWGWFDFPVGSFSQGGDGIARVSAPMLLDRVPDEAPDGTLPTYTMQAGPMKQKGGLFAASDDPIRWTNGEASTLTFQTRVANTADTDLPVSIDVRKAKPEWTIAYSDKLTIPANTAINVTYLVTIPFTHSHGLLHMFEAAVESTDGEHLAVAELGVYWPDVPQPAGHHNEIWFHSLTEEESGFVVFDAFRDGVHGWMSAKEDEDLDEQVPISSQFTIPPNPQTGNRGIAYWGIPLEPSLRMGMDFRPDEDGTIVLNMNFPTPIQDGTVSVYLTHQIGNNRFSDDTTFLASGTSEPLEGTVSGEQQIEIVLDVAEEADLMPYQQDTNLVVSVVLDAAFVAGGVFLNPEAVVPQILPADSVMTLPLDEYHDPLDLSFQTDGSLEILVGPEGQERLVNGGRTVVYTFDVQFNGDATGEFHTMLSGTNTEWAEVIGDTSFTIEPGTTRKIGLAVIAPASASDGERADLTLTVMSDKNAAVQAGINTVTIVDSTEDIPDEAERKVDLDGELSTDKEAPGIAIMLLLGALVAVARRRS